LDGKYEETLREELDAVRAFTWFV